MNSRFLYIISLIFVTALSRLLPHPADFTPVLSIAIFSGATLFNKRDSILVPLLAMFISDLFLGFHSLIPVVYGCIILISIYSNRFVQTKSVSSILSTSILSGLFFFIVTNFAVWLTSGMYSLDLTGLQTCYLAAIPFFRNSLAGTLSYSAILFGLFFLIEKYLLLTNTSTQKI
jgi:hypothetical protein